jgi:N-carbamoylputrescine amidase
MNNQSIKIGLIQHASSIKPGENLKEIIIEIKRLAEKGANLITLQELHNSIYFCQAEDPSYFDLAEPIPGASTEILGKAAKENDVVIVSSLFEKRAAGLFHNTAVIFEKDGTIAGKYRKMHIPDDPAYYEKFYFTPGDIGFEPIQTSVGKLGVLVCWDQWYPEAARLMAMKGAEILIYPTAIGWESTDAEAEKQRQYDAWFTIQRAHAIANGLPLISINRCGFEPDWTGVTNGINFWGQSFVCGPQGEILFKAEENSTGGFIVEIDKSRTEVVRRMWPFFRDRRIDSYADLVKRYID